MSAWVLVTGGAKRLGRAVVEAAAERGFNLAIHFNTSADDAAALRDALHAQHRGAIAIGADLSDLEAAGTLVARANDAAGAAMSHLVNAAAIFEHDLIETFTAAQFDRHMRMNALAPCVLSQAFAAALPDDARGSIVNFVDFKLAQPYPDHFTYTLSKYALAGATEMMARALAPRVRVNAVAPGYVLPAPGQAIADYQRLHAQTPLGVGATPADVARAALYLMESPAVSGQTLYVDAGLRFETHATDFAFR